MMLGAWISRAARELGVLGIVSIASIAAAAALYYYGVKPLEAKSGMLQDRLARQTAQDRASDARLLRDAAPAAKLAAFYRFFQTGQKTTGYLEQLSTIAHSSGVELSSGDYKIQKTDSRIERYEITLPLSGSYAHIRTFLERSLASIPVLSLDQISFRRKNAGDATAQAEAHLTLHLLQETQ